MSRKLEDWVPQFPELHHGSRLIDWEMKLKYTPRATPRVAQDRGLSYLETIGWFAPQLLDMQPIKRSDSRGRPISLYKVSILEKYTEDGEPI